MREYGSWIVKDSLCEGGQGHTFLVYERDDEQKKLFVLKRFKNAKRIDRFESEVIAGLQLDHPNVLRVVDFDLKASGPYVVSEYCEKGPLSKLDLSEHSLVQKLDLFEQICQGVAHAHENRVIHRDLKPDNIFIQQDGLPVVGDFGICFVDEGGERFTMLDEAVGPRNYIAPELEDGLLNEIDTRSDVYSLGKLLYWILRGRVFSREEHRQPEYDLAAESAAILPGPYHLINELLDQMIVADRSLRLESAGQVTSAVRVLAEKIEARAHPIDLNAPQLCLYCASGLYQTIASYSHEHSVGDPGHIRNLGLNPVGGTIWLVFACDYCGHIQIFRPDRTNDRNRWFKSRAIAE